MKKGSITLFCALSLMLVASLLFALLESARIYRLDTYAALKAESGMDSLCGVYQPFLWQQYGLLFLDGAFGTGKFSMDYVSEELEKQIKASMDTSGFSSCEVVMEGYSIATDSTGELFLNYVAERQKENLPLGIAEDVYQLYHHADEIEQEYAGTEDAIKEAQSVFADIKTEWQKKVDGLWKEKENNPEIEVEIINPDTTVIESTWNTVEQMQNSSILNLVFGEMTGLSQKQCRLESTLKERKKEVGTMTVSTEESWYRKILVLLYLEEYFSCYEANQKSHFLDYEMEYVLCGEDSEWENLEGALKRILLLREAANTAYLVQDKEKMALAEALANIVGLMAGENPAVVKVIKAGIIGAWAYCESILDLRSLVMGEKIPLIKKDNEWTMEITNIFSVFDKNVKAKVCSEGLEYADYLKQLLFMTADEELAYRMMEVMEIGMKEQEDYQNCRMDHMLVMLKYKVNFASKPIFQSFITAGKTYNGELLFTKEVQRSYIP